MAKSGPMRVRLISAAGIAIILLSAGAALLPALGRVPGTFAIGVLLVIVGLIEMLAGPLRRETKTLAMLPGLATVIAGGVFLRSEGHLVTSVNVITAWLLVRSVILFVTSQSAHGSSRTWLGLSALTDFVLGAILLAGLSAATIVVMVFGPTPQLVAAFAWILALSFVVTGTLLLEIASCQGDQNG